MFLLLDGFLRRFISALSLKENDGSFYTVKFILSYDNVKQ
ncbi:conserved hypothetical protein [Treponema phagedenis]|uniref:Uncharacterized protein n=1 Tax=Treponema phagedenis TaxID=162 RepID=A0A0B7GVR3_TREPH|nr:hypothetical protein HMPREF9554_00705 [Treponema phagedenis F0421]CEM60766.1 conserved hypothetical protein [Treponema phagedenis]